MSRILKRSVFVIYLFNAFILSKFEVKGITVTDQLTKLEHKYSLDDSTCLTQDLLMSINAWDVSRCAFRCVEDAACKTVFYNSQEGKCSGCSARYTSSSLPVQSPGFIHFQKVQTSCDDGWTKYQKSCYALSPQGNFMDGVNYCQNNNAHPVFVETSEENEFLKTYLRKDTSHSYWYIGMTDHVQNGVWYYYGTVKRAIFRDFYRPMEPSDTTVNAQECVIFVGLSTHNYQWGDSYCYPSFPTICEKTL